MSPNDDDFMFVQALREDLPSSEQQERMRRRFLLAGVAAASLASTSAASASSASWGATLFAKVAGLSWPATLVLAAAVATPIAALPVWLSPARGPESRLRAPVVPASVVSRPSALMRTELASPPDRSALVEHAADPRERPRAVRQSETPASRPPARSASAAVAATPVPALRAEVAPFAAPPAAPPIPKQPEAPQSASTLGAETQLLERAFSELAAGRDSAAAALIAQHERQFPNGLLRQERERARARLNQYPKGE